MRIFILLTIPVLCTTFYYCLEFANIHVSFDVSKLKKDTINTVINEKLNELKDKENTLSSLIKLPTYLSRYNIYAENNFMTMTKNDRYITTKFRLDIDKNYKEIDFGKKEKIISFLSFNDLKFDEFKKIEYSYSFRYYFEDTLEEVPEGMYANFVENKKFIKLYLRPTIPTTFIVFILTLAIWYGFLLLLNGCYKFILHGRPFIEK